MAELLCNNKTTVPLEHLTILQNPVCDLSQMIIRPFVISCFCPHTLLSFNDVLITEEERQQANVLYNNCFIKLVNGNGNSTVGGKANVSNSSNMNSVIGYPLRKQNTRLMNQLNNINFATNAVQCMNERKLKVQFEVQFNDVVSEIVRATLADCVEYNY